MNKFICVHGHFYQPPRENAWLERIEFQDSAAPYHDWNERISHECYGPNAVSRILSDDRRIVDIVNNYAKMSFNFGPTLLSWMENERPKTYAQILEADWLSQKHFGGHGSAMAQVYNHIIMPLANRRDKESQVQWGIRDFEKRFGRFPEGMWLAETAVDTETLEVLAEAGIKFTILAPRQAKQFRDLSKKRWNEGVDTKNAYICNLPSGKTINLFFYDGERSQSVAFKGLLQDGREFARYLVEGFDNRSENQLVHIATDGESYGHRRRRKD
jgi:alpha-amylase/alpha-mannosidase (GH57 family)